MPINKINAVDLFCGAGGLTKGLENVGINVGLGIDIDPACEYVYEKNNKARFLLESVENITVSDLKNVYNEESISLLAGCAPCQTFSTYNRKATQSDERWWLLLQFSRLIKESSPKLVTMENVPSLIKQDVFKDFVSSLEKSGYYVNFKIINCSEYGVAQHRKRLVLLASRYGPVELLTPVEFGSKKVTVREAIGNLPNINAGSASNEDPLHQSSSLTSINLKRIQASKPGGTWKDWHEDLIANCHKKKSGETYSSVYGRMRWDEPSPTMTTQFYGFGNGRFGHPDQDRAISLREGAILQSFPKDYDFIKKDQKVSIKTIGRMIGNAVPVKLGELIGKSLLAHISKLNCSDQ